MRNKVILLFGMLAIFAQISKAQQETPKSFTLKEAVEYAKKNNYSLVNSKLDMLSAQKKVNEILASGLPQVNGSANLIDNTTIGSNVIVFGGQKQVIKFGTPYASTIALSANQLLFDGTFILGVKASKEFVNLSKLSINRTEIETEVSVSKAYYLALLMDVNEKMMSKNIETLEKSKSDLEQFFKNGFAEKVDLDRLMLQLSNLQLQRDKIHDQKLVAQMVLKLQMGLNVNSPIELSDKLEDLFQKSTVEETAEKVNYSNRVEYKMLQEQLVLNNLDKKRYYMGYFPTLSAFYNNQRNTFGNNFSDLYTTGSNTTIYPASSIGLNLAVPIFGGFRKTFQLQQAAISIKKTENDIKNFENAIDQQVFQYKTAYNRTRQQIDIQKKNYELAQQIYNRTEIKYKNGVGSSLELTTSQSDLENARTNYLTTMYDYFIADLDLKKAVGAIK